MPNVSPLDWARTAAFSPNGRLVLTGAENGSLSLWDLSTGKLLRVLAGHEAFEHWGTTRRNVTAIAFSPDGTRAVTGGEDRTIRLWEIATGRQLHSAIANHWTIAAVAFTPDGRTIISGGPHDIMWNDAQSPDRTRPRTLRAWKADTLAPLHTFANHTDAVSSLTISPDGRRVATTGDVIDGIPTDSKPTLKVWEVATGRLVKAFAGVGKSPHDRVAFMKDGAQLATLGMAESAASTVVATVWEIDSGRQVMQRKFPGVNSDGSYPNLLSANPDGRFIVARNYQGDGEARKRPIDMWLVSADGVTRQPSKFGDLKSLGSDWVVLSNDERQLGGGVTGDTAVLGIWSDDGRKRLLQSGSGGGVRNIAFAKGNKRLLLMASGEGETSLWDLETLTRRSRALGNLDPTSSQGQRLGSGVSGVVPLFDESLLAVLGDTEPRADGQCDAGICASQVVDSRTGAAVLPLTADEMIIQLDPASPPKKMATYQAKARAVRLWDLAELKIVKTMPVRVDEDGGGRSVAVSTRQKWLAYHAKQEIRIVEIATGKQRSLKSAAQDFDLSEDEQQIATIDGSGVVKTYKLSDLGLASEIDKKGCSKVKFAARDKHLLLSCRRSFQVHSLVTGKSETVVRSGSGQLHASYLSPDRLLLGSRYHLGGEFAIWDSSGGGLIKLFSRTAHEFDSISMSPNGGSIAAGEGQVLRLLDAKTGNVIKDLRGHVADVTRTAFSSDGSWLVSASNDGSVKIWDVASGREVLTIVSRDKNTWMAMTPEGFFAASSREVTDMQAIVRGLDAWGIDQVWQSLYNPDLVREALAGDPNGEVKKAAAVISLDAVIDSGPAPDVRITSPRQGGQSSVEEITLEARITGEARKGIGRIEWRVNRITVGVLPGPHGQGAEYRFTQKIALEPGDNIIELVAYDAKNVIASSPERTTVTFAPTGAAANVKPNLHVLAIGINTYKDASVKSLSFAVRDAKAIGRTFQAAGQGMYGAIRVETILDADATQAGIQAAIDRMAKNINPRDTFIFFAAAHGVSEKGRFYLIPSDYQGGADALEKRTISQDRFQDWIVNRIKARKVLILLDTCESGALVGGYNRSRVGLPLSEAAVGRLHEATGRPVLAAAAEGQTAKGGIATRNHGVFTRAILLAIINGDIDNDGQIDLTELVTDVQYQVPELAKLLADQPDTAPAKGVTAADRNKQSARSGSLGENFKIVRRLELLPPE